MLPCNHKRNQGTSRTKFYKELGTESLSFRRWFRRPCTYKIKTQREPKYLYKLIPLKNNTYDTRSRHPLCTCSLEVESTKQFFLHCHYYSALRISFLNDLNNISPQFALFPEDVFVKTLLYGNPVFDENGKQEILGTSIRYILNSKRFSGDL